jgi:hypothetical protein
MGLMPTPTMLELYEILTKSGFSPDVARRATEIIVTQDEKAQLATKEDIADLKLAFSQLKADIAERLNDQMKWQMGLMVAMTAIFSAIVKLFP